jgi:hypothetical protein
LRKYCREQGADYRLRRYDALKGWSARRPEDGRALIHVNTPGPRDA